MKIFQTIQKSLKVLGIQRQQSGEFHRFTLKNVFISILCALSIVSSGAYSLYEAENYSEYLDSIYAVLGLSVCSAFYGMFLWKMANVFRLIANFEQQVQKRKFIQFNN